MRFDIEHIAKCMIEYDTGVPIYITRGICLIVCVLVVIFYQYNTDIFVFIRKTSWSILGGYVFFILCSTVLFRDKAEEMHYFLQPFWSYTELYNRRIAEIILNILMFIPIGFFGGAAIKKASVLKVTGIGCLLSLSIETLQLLTRSGIFNIDDIIHNTLGCIIGFLCYVLCYKLIKRAA